MERKERFLELRKSKATEHSHKGSGRHKEVSHGYVHPGARGSSCKEGYGKI